MTRKGLEQQVDQIIEQYVGPTSPGASVLIGRDDEVLLAKGYGMADVEGGEPITPTTRFVLGSVTKQFAAMAVMLLERRGLVSYDAPIGRYLPEMPAAWRDRITVRQLIHHTSGVPEYLTDDWWEGAVAGKYGDHQSIVDCVAALDELEFEPGSRWRYCNSGYILLGALVERVAGQSFASFLNDNIFNPLGMDNTYVGEDDSRRPRLATGYMFKSKEEFKPAPWHFAVVGGADGNVISDTTDLYRWSQALYTEKLAPREALGLATVPCRPHDPTFSRYGFGLMIGERRGVRVVSHGGGTLGYVTHLANFTDERLTIVVLTNAAGCKVTRIAGELANLMLADKMAPLVRVALPDEHLAEKVGLYIGKPRDSEMKMTVTLPSDGDELRLAIDFGGMMPPVEHDLLPLGRDLFCAEPETDSYVHFLRDGGRVIGLRLTSLGSVLNLDRGGDVPDG